MNKLKRTERIEERCRNRLSISAFSSTTGSQDKSFRSRFLLYSTTEQASEPPCSTPERRRPHIPHTVRETETGNVVSWYSMKQEKEDDDDDDEKTVVAEYNWKQAGTSSNRPLVLPNREKGSLRLRSNRSNPKQCPCSYLVTHEYGNLFVD